MPLPEIARYAEMVRAGAGNEGERLELLKRHQAAVRAQMAVLKDALDLISTKVAAYTEALSLGTASELFIKDGVDDAYFAARGGASPHGPAPAS